MKSVEVMNRISAVGNRSKVGSLLSNILKPWNATSL